MNTRTLRVEITAVGPYYVDEETWTHNKKFAARPSLDRAWQAVLPEHVRNSGWVIADHHDGAGSTRWVRRRTRKPEEN
ncbi:hypothetical protein ML401_20225 [Bradyrhizobium sp. 62B]|nr:hypothetical protein ML401_20225 [Bradyrhizobium sp. 62B]